jgi:hypothetical protein
LFSQSIPLVAGTTDNQTPEALRLVAIAPAAWRYSPRFAAPHWRVPNIVDGESPPPNCSTKARAVAKLEKLTLIVSSNSATVSWLKVSRFMKTYDPPVQFDFQSGVRDGKLDDVRKVALVN